MQQIINLLMNNDFFQAEKLLLETIKKDPINAQAWLYLGEALCFQGYGKTARKVFQRAWLLDPQAAWIDMAQADLKEADPNKTKKDIEELLVVKNITVTAAIMVKNEEHHINNCMKNLVPAMDEIIIIDTGCTDNTIKIAKTFPKVKVIEFEWCDDFSAARNAAIPHIKSDWVLWIDADEYLYKEDIKNIRTVAAIYDDVNAPVLLRIGHMNETTDGQVLTSYDINRMFSLKYPYKFYSRIHEQIKLEGTDMYESAPFSKSVRIRVYHNGYTLSEMKQKNKLNRNIHLLKMMVEDEPNNPAWLFFYGRELCAAGKIDNGIDILLQCEKVSKNYPSFGRLLDVHTILANAYLSKKDLDKAEEVCIRSLKIRNDFPNTLYILARIKVERSLQLLNEAEKYVVNSLNAFETYRGIVSPDESIRIWKGDLLYSDIALHQGKIAKAVEGYKKSLQLIPASAKDSIKSKIDIINNQFENIHNFK